MERKTFPLAVHLFLKKGDMVLLLRRFQTGYEDGNYSVIAGHADGGEDVYAAMIREAKEEAGITIRRENLFATQVMHRKTAGDERVDYFFTCEKWEGEIQIAEPDKCDELRWAGVHALPENTIPYIREAMENDLRGVAFSLFGWECGMDR